MHRDKFTTKLVRIVESIESGKLPMDVRELYVFGSYSRGAIQPGDLDLIIVHGPGRQKIDEQVDKALQKSHPNILEQVRVAAGSCRVQISPRRDFQDAVRADQRTREPRGLIF